MSKTKITVAVALLALVSLSLAACAGFDVGDLVRVKTPNTIQQQTGLASSTSLNEAEAEYRAWHENVKRASSQWKTNIERGNQIRGLLNQITLSALDTVGPTLGGVPVLGPALPAVTGLLGLFFGAGKLRKEKESSFNKGLQRGREFQGTAAVTTDRISKE
jgi:hypothetical protein